MSQGVEIKLQAIRVHLSEIEVDFLDGFVMIKEVIEVSEYLVMQRTVK